MDPYAILIYRTQEQRSSIAKGVINDSKAASAHQSESESWEEDSGLEDSEEERALWELQKSMQKGSRARKGVQILSKVQKKKAGGKGVSGKGSNPEWNESFLFTVSDHVSELTIKLMDSDKFSSDDFVGEAKIPLEPLFLERVLPPMVYNVVKDQEYHGEIKVGLTFTPEPQEDYHQEYNEENYGGWREPSWNERSL